jgi:iron-sulfur cluster assembly protein
MLMVTENAGQAIESIVANAEMPDGSGLRIDAPDEPPAPDGSGVALQLQVASQPAEQDQVVSEGGAKVFIAPSAARMLAGAVARERRVLERSGLACRGQLPCGAEQAG